VFVVGAGFSAELGYPLTKILLIDVWNRLGKIVELEYATIARVKSVIGHEPLLNSK
jgi:hypothetical protein